MEFIHILVLAFLVGSVALGYAYKTNIGVFAIPLAFIAAFYYGLKPNEIINLWGLNLFFILVSITFFYGFAIGNGTLNLVAQKAIYSSRKYPWSIPIVLFIVVAVFVGIGPGHYAGFAFMSPLVLYIANKINMSKMLAAIIIYSGSCAGGFNPFTLGGRFVNGLILSLGYTQTQAYDLTLSVGKNMFLIHTLIFIVGYFLLKGYKVHANEIQKPEKINSQQIRTLFLVALIFGLVMVPSVWLALTPDNVMLKNITKILNPTFLCFIGVALALIFKIGDEKVAFKNIPWDLILMVGGLGMLIALAKKAGAMDALSVFLNSVDSGNGALAYFLGLASSGMSVFASSMGVVMPAFFPIVPKVNIDAALGLSIVACFATFTGYSPFSSGGALVLAGTKDVQESREVFIRLLILPIILVICSFVLLYFGFFN